MAREIELISYESNNQELVGKINIEDLKTKSNIIVNESQEALFYKDGQALDLFTAGRHELKTDSLPIFKRIFKSLFGTNSPLPCTVYFINKVNVLDMNWGTPSPITLEDPKYHLIVNVGANGSMGVKIADSRKFVIKVMGQINSVSVDDIKRSIKGVMVANIKDCISNVIIKQGVSILEIQTQLLSLSEKMQKEINDRIIEEWGIELVNFYFNNITASDSDLEVLKQTREKYMSSMNDIEIESTKTLRVGQAEAQVKLQQGLIDAQIMIAQGKAEKEVMDALGVAGWSKLQSAEILKKLAENPGSGGLASAGAGFGMGMAMTGMFSGLSSQLSSPILHNDANQGAATGQEKPAEQDAVTEQQDPVKVLGKLKQLLDAGLIEPSEYEQKKKEILARM